jgi:hypothetical protein
MKVKIKQDGIYSKFVSQKAKAQELKAGTVIDFPKWYAESLIASELAESATEHVKQLASADFEEEIKSKRSVRRGRSKKQTTDE